MEISQANIIITGAASGFGKAMSLYFNSKGANIFALDINEESLLELKSEATDIHVFNCDITNNSEVESVVEAIFKVNKGINILINNAGIMKNAPLVNLLKRPDNRHTIELWNNIIQVNQNAVFYMSRSVVSNMIINRNKGIIINISSIAAKGNVGQTAYSASKAAVEAMTKVWAKELAPFGIRSNAISPGFINTLGTHDAIEEKMLSRWISKTPLQRTGTVDEIVASVAFTIENDFVNGEILNVNGGLVL